MQAYNQVIDRKKVILVLVDALREDFVELGCPSSKDDNTNNYMCGVGADNETLEAYRYLDPKRSRYKNRKMKLFSKLAHEEPDNAFLAPMRSEMPTVTAIRVKSLMTGALNSYIEVKDNFGGSAV